MKKRKNTNYLIVASAHLGMSEDILAVYARVAEYYKAKVIHLGPLVTDKEHKIYNRSLVQLKRLEDQETDSSIAKSESVAELIETLVVCQESRMNLLQKHFRSVTFVTTEDMSLPVSKKLKHKISMGDQQLSAHLNLCPIPPSGVRAALTNTPTRAAIHLKERGSSSIIAHPVPGVISKPRVGINQAYCYFSVGSLKHTSTPRSTGSLFEVQHMPCAVLAIVDDENGEFHPKQLHIDYQKGKNNKTGNAMVLDDGLVFTESGTKETVSADRATFTTDDHAPLCDPGVVGCLRALNTMFSPATYINGGDTCNFDSVSRHDLHSPGEMEGRRLVNDLSALRTLLSAYINTDSIKKKILIDSNHHEWVTNFIKINPNLIGLLDWNTLARDMFSDWDLYIRDLGDNRVCKFGNLTIRHGDKEQLNAAEAMFEDGYLCGHHHSYKSYRRAIQLGCASVVFAHRYTGNSVNGWINQIASITKHKEITAVNPKVILHDKLLKVSRFAYRDRIYEVDHFEINHKPI